MTRQDKTVKTDAVELNDAALDRAAGGADGSVYTVTFQGAFVGTANGGAWKTTNGGKT